MAYNTKALLLDVNNKPIPQYYDPVSDSFQPMTNGIVNKNTAGTEIFTDASPASVKSTGSLTPVKTVTILSGATGLSDIIDLEGYQLFGIQMPATWVTANITFQTSFDGTTFQDAYDDSGLEITLQALQGKNISVDINALKLAPWKYVKFRSGTSGTPVDQTATRVLKIVAKV